VYPLKSRKLCTLYQEISKWRNGLSPVDSPLQIGFGRGNLNLIIDARGVASFTHSLSLGEKGEVITN